jgi:hypothetical protein
MDVIARIEAVLTLPSEGQPIMTYVRYYASYTRDGRRRLRALFIAPRSDQRPGIQVLPEADVPLAPLDGGCGGISLIVDVDSGTAESVHCNGEA